MLFVIGMLSAETRFLMSALTPNVLITDLCDGCFAVVVFHGYYRPEAACRGYLLIWMALLFAIEITLPTIPLDVIFDI